MASQAVLGMELGRQLRRSPDPRQRMDSLTSQDIYQFSCLPGRLYLKSRGFHPITTN